MKISRNLGWVLGLAAVLAASSCGGEPVPDVETATGIAALKARRGCGAHIQSCTAAEVGQPCDPSNLSVLCSAQSNGSYCCLAYAP